jgi:hypothetical protein
LRLDASLAKTYYLFTNGKDLLVCQRAKVGKLNLADFFVPLVGAVGIAPAEVRMVFPFGK